MPIKLTENVKKIFFQLTLPSYRFFKKSDISQFYIICPKSDIDILKTALSEIDLPFILIDENNVCSYEGIDWYKQQIIKLNMAGIIKTEYYLVLDSDIFLTKPFSYSDMFCSGKLKMSSEKFCKGNISDFAVNPSWWESSCKVLNYNITDLYERDLMSVTPQILITSIVKELIQRLINIDRYWPKLICDNKCTEFTLYYIHLLQTKKENLYINLGHPLFLFDKETNVLDYNQDSKVIQNSFLKSKAHFCVLQSYLKQDLNPFLRESRKYTTTNIALVASYIFPERTQHVNYFERLEQIIETFKSIRKKIPNCYIICIEGCKINSYMYELYLNYCDVLLYYGDDENMKQYTNSIKNIGIGELKLLEKGIDFIIENNMMNKNFLFKVGARYILNDNFNLSLWDMTKYNFKTTFDTVLKENVYITGLYSIPYSDIHNFKKICDVEDFVMIEKYYSDVLEKSKVNCIDVLGLYGYMSYKRTYFEK